MEYRCTKEFSIGLRDDNGFSIENKYKRVEEDSNWWIDESGYRFIGGQIRLESSDSSEWIEISEKLFDNCFKELC